jgi:hypothetical protein
MKVYLLTVSYSSPMVRVEEIEATKITGSRVYFGGHKWAARQSGYVHDELRIYYENKEEALVDAGRQAQAIRLEAKTLSAKAEALVLEYPVIEKEV